MGQPEPWAYTIPLSSRLGGDTRGARGGVVVARRGCGVGAAWVWWRGLLRHTEKEWHQLHQFASIASIASISLTPAKAHLDGDRRPTAGMVPFAFCMAELWSSIYRSGPCHRGIMRKSTQQPPKPSTEPCAALSILCQMGSPGRDDRSNGVAQARACAFSTTPNADKARLRLN